MEIRDAAPEDAPAGCTVLKRSIAELCEADHKNDPSVLARWLGNKTVENFIAWIEQPDNSLLVAVEDGQILAVGSVTDAGTIGLNYVSPDARFRGVSRALLRALEARAAERGNTQCTLTSTETARHFYLSNGYKESGLPSGAFGTSSGYPMSKSLTLIRLHLSAMPDGLLIREMRPEDARAFLEVHHAAVRDLASKDYSSEVIEAWAPMPITTRHVEAVQSNPDGEYRLVAEIDGRLVGIGCIVAEKNELRACYVMPSASRKGVGSALLREIELAAREQGSTYLEAESSLTAAPFYSSNGYQVRERGEHVLRNGQRMACIKMRKTIALQNP
jgi:GNAT superfamily N-acetyltransferase